MRPPCPSRHHSRSPDWLQDRVHRHGALYQPVEVIERACGFAPGEQPLLDYLEAKFAEVYRL